ncbi:DUF3857 domain-containing protein [Lysobacter firmicutimachus]|uniref:DUF3857 domain-containing protein n=1 Tax=Lysobacter firmicutimachus TaxID=1792846 RepID=A0AAU8MPI9_9GAMM
MPTIVLRLSAAIALSLLAAAVGAQTTQNPEPAASAQAPKAKAAEAEPMRIERLHVDYRVEPNGAYAERREMAVKVLEERAVESAKHRSIGYSASLQRLDVIAAYTQKADGRRVDVPKSNYQVETNEGRAGGGPAFSDQATTSVVFPDVAVGDTVVLDYRLTATQPMFDGHFSEIESFGGSERYYGDVRVRIDAPAAMTAQARGFGGLKTVRDEVAGGRRLIEWSYQNREPVEDETNDYSVYQVERFPGFAFSTFPGYADIARAYAARALPKAEPSARVRKLADEIAAGKTAPREVAQALYEWVSTQINYGGNCIGLGAVVPRDQAFVLDNRLGDCKDHATLLQALLSAKGIESTQALINAGNVYSLPSVPVVASVNHVLNYLPGLDLYVDATAKGIPFGELPAVVAGKPVLRIDRPELAARTPGFAPLRNRQRMVSRLVILEDGSVKGQVEVELAGLPAISSRAGLRELSAEDAKGLVKKMFQSSGLTAEGSFTQDDPKPLRAEHRYRAEFEVKEAMPMPGAFPLGPLFFNPMPVSALTGSAGADALDTLTGDGTCGGGRSEEIYRIEFPKTVKVIAVPPDLSLRSGDSSYVARYKLDGQVLEASRVIEDATAGPVCSNEYNRTYRDFARKVRPNLKAQVVYQQ